MFLFFKRRANIITIITIKIVFYWLTAYLRKMTLKIQTAPALLR